MRVRDGWLVSWHRRQGARGGSGTVHTRGVRPKAVLLDFGGTLVEELEYDPRRGAAWMLARAAFCPPHVTLDDVVARADRVTRELAMRRDEFQIETPWPALTRLIHDFLGIRFDAPMHELEIGFWRAATRTAPRAGACNAMAALALAGVAMAVVSNSSFGEPVIRAELARHGLAEALAFIMVSAEYAVRKPQALLFDTAAARLGLAPRDIWFIGDTLDTDIAGARAAGMTAVWLRPAGADAPTSVEPDRIADDWPALVRLADLPHAAGS
jgi:putative hydrolase of the HAD superfamily